MEKYITAGQAAGDNTVTRHMHNACWIPKATNTHSEYVILISFSTATMVGRKRLIVTLYVHCLFNVNPDRERINSFAFNG